MRAALQHQPHPGDAASKEVGLAHPCERPPLQMLPLDPRVEDDAAAHLIEPDPELDVLDRGHRETLLVEAAKPQEDVAAYGAEACPEGGRRPGVPLMDMVVEEVAEVRDEAPGVGIVVVRAEHGVELGVVVECRSDTGERVIVHFDVGIDEHEDFPLRAARAEVACAGRPETERLVDDDRLLGARSCSRDRRQRAVERRPWARRAGATVRETPVTLREGTDGMPNRKDKAEQTKLSAERLELIHRFMSEAPERENDDVAPVSPTRPRVEQPAAATPNRPRPLEMAPEVPVVAPERPVVVVARAPRRSDMHPRPAGPRGLEGLVTSLRGFTEIGWLAAAVILSLVVVLLLVHPG
jgi:hypothetical protein